jgi:hypothetical protein
VTANVLQVGSTTAGNVTGSLLRPATVNDLLIVSSSGINQVLQGQLAGLLAAGAVIPTPKVEVNNFSGATIDAEAAAKLLPPGSIGVLALQVPFAAEDEPVVQVEKISKWTRARGTTAATKQ